MYLTYLLIQIVAIKQILVKIFSKLRKILYSLFFKYINRLKLWPFFRKENENQKSYNKGFVHSRGQNTPKTLKLIQIDPQMDGW